VSDDILSAEQVGRIAARSTIMQMAGDSDLTTDRLIRSHEALRAERDLYCSLAERYADMWQPQFPLNPDEGLWVFPWADDVADEAMTPEQVAWYRARREAKA
jgi:hypothetical protein